MSEELRKACFEVARCVKWSRKPVDADEISELASKFYEIAKDQKSTGELEIDLPLITRAVRYLGSVHANPPMDDNTRWFYNKLRVVLEIARPNAGIDEENKEFLRDMLQGIVESLSD
jgi:hypothetical protein